MGQIPPQYVYVDSNCQAVIPDYRPLVKASDNCGTVNLIQTPEAGYILGFTGLSREVVIRAVDASNNYAQVKFTVIAIDTIPPVIDSTSLMVDSEMDRIEYLYNKADIAVARKMQEFDELFPYEDYGIIKDDVDSTYFKKMMFISVGAGHAITGYGHRFWQWQNPGDTIIIQ